MISSMFSAMYLQFRKGFNTIAIFLVKSQYSTPKLSYFTRFFFTLKVYNATMISSTFSAMQYVCASSIS